MIGGREFWVIIDTPCLAPSRLQESAAQGTGTARPAWWLAGRWRLRHLGELLFSGSCCGTRCAFIRAPPLDAGASYRATRLGIRNPGGLSPYPGTPPSPARIEHDRLAGPTELSP
jgi:hypothetical protein